MTMENQASGWRNTRLLTRLAVVNILALLPLVVLSAIHTRALESEARRNQAQAVMGRTIKAAQSELSAITAARTLAQTLAVIIPDVMDDPVACARLMSQAMPANPRYTIAAFVPFDGSLDCASDPRASALRSHDLFSPAQLPPDPRMFLVPHAPISGQPVLAANWPVFREDGTHVGRIITTAVHRAPDVDTLEEALTLNDHAIALITFDNNGNILTASEGLEQAGQQLPSNHTLRELAGSGVQEIRDDTRDGQPRLYSIVPITDEIHLMGIWGRQGEQIDLLHNAVGPYLMVILAILSGLAAAIIATDRLVIRHIRSLSEAMYNFTSGRRNMVPLPLDDPPAEIRQLADAYETLTSTLQQEEASQEDLLRQKEHLLREVHHRTGNSLQLIASILRLHLREASSPEVKSILSHLLNRVMNLSSVHLGLYRIAHSSEVSVNELIADVASKVDQSRDISQPGRRIHSYLDPLRVSTQQAVPMALLLAELLSAFLDCENAALSAPIIVQLENPGDGPCRLSVTGPSAAAPAILGIDDGGAPGVIAARLIRNFVRQMEGDLEVHKDDLHLTLTIIFVPRQPVPFPAPI